MVLGKGEFMPSSSESFFYIKLQAPFREILQNAGSTNARYYLDQFLIYLYGFL